MRPTAAVTRYFADFGPRLVDNGWPVFPGRVRDKAPAIEGWTAFNTRLPSDDQVEAWCRLYPTGNVCLALGQGVFAFDFDIDEAVLSEKVGKLADEILGPTPLVRIGRPNRCVRLYGGNVSSMKAKPLEVFGTTGQVVIYGEHPQTGRPYLWPFEEPLWSRPENLPRTTQAAVDKLVRDAFTIIAPEVQRARRSQPMTASDFDVFNRLRQARQGKRGAAWVKVLAQQLGEASQGVLHNSMVSVVAALVARGYTDTAIKTFVDKNLAAPRSGPYAAVWSQIDNAIAGARRRYGILSPTTVRVVNEQ